MRTRHRIPGTVPVDVRARGTGRPERLPPEAADADRPRGRPRGDPHHAVLFDPARARGGRAGAGADGGVPEVHFGWSAENPVTANLHFVLFGTGNVPWMVYTLIRRADVPEERRPHVVVG